MRRFDVVLFDASDVTVMTVESSPFHSHFLDRRNRTRIEITAAKGDTWRNLGTRYGCSLGSLERVNRRSRRSKLRPGEKVVVYARRGLAGPAAKPKAKPAKAPKAGSDDAKSASKPAPG